MSELPRLVGIVNVTTDSFSDGGRYLAPEAALGHARALAAAGAHVVELGPASSHPDAAPVAPDEEIRRLEPVLPTLVGEGIAVGVDSFQPATQQWAVEHGAVWVNDIQGFPDAGASPALADATGRLVVMHSVQRAGRATRVATDAGGVVDGMYAFFEERLRALDAAGIARDRLVLDPGMGFFLGRDPEPSVRMLQELPGLRARFGLPVLVSVSRKSFLRRLAGCGVDDSGPATLAAELQAARLGADYLRTHDVAALGGALAVARALAAP